MSFIALPGETAVLAVDKISELHLMNEPISSMYETVAYMDGCGVERVTGESFTALPRYLY